jgi:hypothetical protein
MYKDFFHFSIPPCLAGQLRRSSSEASKAGIFTKQVSTSYSLSNEK